MADVGSAATGPIPAPEAGPDALGHDLERALRQVVRRVRLQRALSAAAAFAIAGLIAAAAAVCLAKLGEHAWARAGLALAIALPLLGALAGALRRVDRVQAARALDRDLGRPDLLASGWAFAQLPPAARSPFMHACIRQANAQAPHADPRRALPLRAPRALRPAAVLGVGVAALAALDLSPPPKPAVAPPHKPRLLVHQDDLQAVASEVEPLLAARETDPALRESAAELNALLEALHDGELERAQALASLRALERKLELSTQSEDDQALREALRGLGRSLDGDTLAQSVSDAFAAADAAAARAELERLAGALQQPAPPRADALRKLGKALERAAAPTKPNDAALQKARAELDRLLRKRAKDKKQADPQQERLLRDKRRELDRLEREQQQRESAERKLDRLRRELSGASSSAQGNRAGEAGKQLERAAEQLAQSQREQLTSEQREQLRKRLSQLRELISKQKSGQQGQAQRGGQQRGGQGQGQAQRLDLDRFVGLSRGKGEQGGQDAQGAQGKGKPQGKLLVPGGKGGEPDTTLIMPGGERQASTAGAAEEPVIAGTEAGEGGRPESGAQTKMQGTRVDTRVQGAESEGPTRSEVILEAGQRGFVSRGYERVHTDYERHAEAVLERDKVPGGYRFYVRRYFQLIRPREGQP